MYFYLILIFLSYSILLDYFVYLAMLWQCSFCLRITLNWERDTFFKNKLNRRLKKKMEPEVKRKLMGLIMALCGLRMLEVQFCVAGMLSISSDIQFGLTATLSSSLKAQPSTNLLNSTIQLLLIHYYSGLWLLICML